MKALAAIFLATVGAVRALAQPVCPPVNFQQLAQIKLQNRPQKILSGMLRQPDQSFSQVEITGNIQAKTTSLVGIVPDIQLSQRGGREGKAERRRGSLWPLGPLGGWGGGKGRSTSVRRHKGMMVVRKQEVLGYACPH